MGGHNDDEDERRRCVVEGMDGPYTGPKQEAAAAIGWAVFIVFVVVLVGGASIYSWWTKRADKAYEARRRQQRGTPLTTAIGPA